MLRWIGWLLLWAMPLAAQTVLPDTLRTDTLRVADSPFEFYDLVVIPIGSVVRVEPGVEFIAHQEVDTTNAGLIIHGVFQALGTEEDPIVFRISDEARALGLRWNGLQFTTTYQDSAEADSTIGIIDRLPSRLAWCQISRCNIGVISNLFDNGHQPEQPFNMLVEHCFFEENTISLYANWPSETLIRNNLFRNPAFADIQLVYSTTTISNNFFMRDGANPSNAPIRLFDTSNLLNATITHNGYSQHFSTRDSLLRYQGSTGQEITYLDPDPASFIADPFFQDTLSWLPDPVWSPLIDTGDPQYTDPDGSRSDIGLRHLSVEDFSPEFQDAPDSLQWVTGFDYQYDFTLIGYPIPEVQVLEAPPGLTVTQNARTRIRVEWPDSLQQDGVYDLRLLAETIVNGSLEQDSVRAVLEFISNRAPDWTLVSPCPDGEGQCLDPDPQGIVIDDRIARDTLDVEVAGSDFDTEFLGLDDVLLYSVYRDGQRVASSVLTSSDTMRYSEVLDTARVDLQIEISDGQLSRVLRYDLRPRYQEIAGQVSGTIDPAQGPVYILGRVQVPEGDSFTIPSGTRLVIGETWNREEAAFQVDGVLELTGSPSQPVEFISRVPWTGAREQIADPRPDLFRLGPEATVAAFRNTRFEGFDEVLRLEYLQGTTRIQDCDFHQCRMGVLAIESPVDVRNCWFSDPADSAQLGSHMLYLAGGEGHSIRNSLFVNPVNAITLVGAQAEVHNNSFHSSYVDNGGFQIWMPSWMVGGARVLCLESVADLRNNLFHFKTRVSGTILTLDRLLEAEQRAIWLDSGSEVATAWNWYDIPDARLSPDTTQTGETVYYDRLFASNDTTLMVLHASNGSGPAGFSQEDGFLLLEESPLIDAGDPAAAMQDSDGSRNDIGWGGGPLGRHPGGLGSLQGPGEELLALPSTIRLAQAAPNPFNPRTTIRFELGLASVVRLAVYDIRGRRVADLVRDRLEPGVYDIAFDGSGMASGPYFVHAEAAGGSDTLKLLLLK